MCYLGWGGSCRVRVLCGVGWVMQAWSGSCRDGWVIQGWVGHVGVGWGEPCKVGVGYVWVGWVMQEWGGSCRGGWVMMG